MKYIWALLGVLFIASAFLYASHKPALSQTDKPLPHTELATTRTQQEQGLSGRTSLPDDYGMLFIFQTDGDYGFWMKDMLVPIDIIWIADTGAIVKIDDSVATSTYPAQFEAPVPVRYVLETRAGLARARGWDVGTLLPLP